MSLCMVVVNESSEDILTRLLKLQKLLGASVCYIKGIYMHLWLLFFLFLIYTKQNPNTSASL